MVALRLTLPDCPAPGARTTSLCAACAARPFSVCAAVTDTDLGRLEALADSFGVDKGEAVFREDDPATSVYNVTVGALRLSRLLPDGRRQILGFAFAGDFLGLDRAAAHFATAEALESSRLCRFPRTRFEALMGDCRDLEAALLAKSADALAMAQAQVLLLGRKTALERVASFLLALAGRDPMRPVAAHHVHLAMTRLEIADYLGLTLETVSRSLSALKRRGLIHEASRSELVIVQRAALVAAAGGDVRA